MPATGGGGGGGGQGEDAGAVTQRQRRDGDAYRAGTGAAGGAGGGQAGEGNSSTMYSSGGQAVGTARTAVAVRTSDEDKDIIIQHLRAENARVEARLAAMLDESEALVVNALKEQVRPSITLPHIVQVRGPAYD